MCPFLVNNIAIVLFFSCVFSIFLFGNFCKTPCIASSSNKVYLYCAHTSHEHKNKMQEARSIYPKMSGVLALRGATYLQRSIELPKHHIYFEKRQASRFSFCFLFLLNFSMVRKWDHKRLLRKANTDVGFNHHNLST